MTRIAIGLVPQHHKIARFGGSRKEGRCLRRIIIPNIGPDKSLVDDLNKEPGIVSMRVGFVLRSAEIKPLFQRFVIFLINKSLFIFYN